MDFDPPAAVRPLLEQIERFVADVVMPAEAEVMTRGWTASAEVLADLRARCKAADLWGPQLPAALGGLGLGLVEHGLVSERLGRTPLGHYVFGCQAPDAGNLEILHKYGTAEQQARWLEPLAHGDIRSCFAMTEPENPGSNPTILSCTARRDGSEYVIDGHKWFTSSADGAAFAIVMAVTNPDAASHARASMIIVPTDTLGFERVRNIPIMGDAGDGWASHSELRFHGVRVPVEHRLGAEGAGFLIAQERLGPGRIHHCMRWIGICERVFDTMCTHVTRRKIRDGGDPRGAGSGSERSRGVIDGGDPRGAGSGSERSRGVIDGGDPRGAGSGSERSRGVIDGGDPRGAGSGSERSRGVIDDTMLASRQIVQAWVAEARAEIDASRLMVLHAAWTIEHKGFAAARDQVSVIKFYVADVMLRLIDRAIQLHGALGITSDTILAHYYVHERGARIYDGPDEVHKMVVAKRILARYAEGRRD